MDDAEEIESEISEELESLEGSNPYEGSFVSANSDAKKPVVATKPPIKAAVTNDDDYSFSFEENESNVNGTNYSQDFEVDESVITSRKETDSKPVPRSSGAATAVSLIPSLGLQAIQAELSLQQLSEEVIQLRNKQRNLLKERWQQVKEKKSRAEARRQQHMSELNDLRQKVQISNSEQESLKASLSSALIALRSAEGLAEAHKESNAQLMQSFRIKDEELVVQRNLLLEAQQRISSLESELKACTAELEAAKEDFRVQMSTRDIQIEVMKNATDANEAR
jgi:hypothetical protein